VSKETQERVRLQKHLEGPRGLDGGDFVPRRTFSSRVRTKKRLGFGIPNFLKFPGSFAMAPSSRRRMGI